MRLSHRWWDSCLGLAESGPFNGVDVALDVHSVEASGRLVEYL